MSQNKQDQDKKKKGGRYNLPQHFKPGQSGNPNGRPKGSKVEFSKKLVSDVHKVWEKLGGADGLYNWAMASKTNLRLFYKMVMSKLPMEISLDANIDTNVNVVISDKFLPQLNEGVIDGEIVEGGE